jgi:hypothetical protein
MNQMKHIELYNWTLQADRGFSPRCNQLGFSVF